VQTYQVAEGQCAGAPLCPLSCVAIGATVCIKKLSSAPETQDRLRELGLGEEQRVKLVSRQHNIICQVCNARLGLSEELAETILVEAVPAPSQVA
jgi:Fe2+ transport system protein FeoA